MNVRNIVVAIALSLTTCFAVKAQAPASAPAGATGLCKDGTYSKAASKSGACGGHKGVQTWYAAATPGTAAAPQAPKPAVTTPSPAATQAPAPATKAAAPVSKAAVSGGGPGMVWVNSATNVYHCPGTKYYGKTKAGKYMSEADAKAAGAHADHNTPCTK